MESQNKYGLLTFVAIGSAAIYIFKDKLKSLLSYFNKQKENNNSNDESSKLIAIDKVSDTKKNDIDEKKNVEYPSLEGIKLEDVPNLDNSYISNFKFEDWDINKPSINSIETDPSTPYTKAAAEAWSKTIQLSFRKWQTFFVSNSTLNEQSQNSLSNNFNKFVDMFVS